MINVEILDKLKRIKLVIFDLDGTLIDNSLAFKDLDLDKISKLKNLGLKVTIATGRTYQSAEKYIAKLNVEIPVIVCNGAAIVEPQKRNVVFIKYISSKIVKRALEICEYYNLSTVIYFDPINGKPCLTKETNEAIDFLNVEGLSEYDVFKTKELLEKSKLVSHVIKMQVVDGKYQLELLKNKLISEFKYANAVLTKINYLEILPYGVTKGSAMVDVAKRLGVDKNSVMSFGDSMNDIELIELSGFGVAMNNAPDELKRRAYLITDNIADTLDQLIRTNSENRI